ncbi:hypothetical protein NL676_009595 [Syzygium grande]|nr:hypothetical protein NL676_009595 [Syzygium grande]
MEVAGLIRADNPPRKEPTAVVLPSGLFLRPPSSGLCLMMAVTAISPHIPASIKSSSLEYPWSGVAVVGLAGCFHTSAYAFGQKLCSQFYYFHVTRPSLVNDFKKMTWSIRSSADGRGLDLDPSADSTNGTTRLIRAIRDFQNKLGAKVREIRKNFSMKLLFFLVGFYCATAFATVIGQTGDWDILSAALAVVVVEGIGALMYRASLPVFSRARSLISMFNYWKAGLSLGLFLDSFNCGDAKISASRMHEAPEQGMEITTSRLFCSWGFIHKNLTPFLTVLLCVFHWAPSPVVVSTLTLYHQAACSAAKYVVFKHLHSSHL